MFASNLPIELLRSIVRYLDVKSYLSLTQSCHYFYDLASVQESEKELLIDEDYWENAMRAEIGGDTTLLKLNEGITWEVVVKSLWQDIKLDWFEVISDPSLYRIASFLHTSNAEDIEDIFERASYRRSLRLLMNEDSFLPACEYHETSEELFDTDESKLFEFFSEITSFKFQLPDQNILRFNIGEQGLYFSINEIDIGRIDGHHCMPALRWDECKKIANYQTITPPYTRDYILVLVALLAFPTGDDIAEYREMVGNAYLATGLIKSQELVDMWRGVLQVTPNWSFDDEIQAWVHPWGARQPANQQTRRIQEILSLLDV